MAELESKTIEDLMRIRRLEGDELDSALKTIDKSDLGGGIDVFRLGIGFPFVRPTSTPYTLEHLKGKSIDGYAISKAEGTFFDKNENRVVFEAEKKLVIGNSELSLRYELEIEYMMVGSIIIKASLRESHRPKKGDNIPIKDIYEGQVIVAADGIGNYNSVASINRYLQTTGSEVSIAFDKNGKYKVIGMSDINDIKFGKVMLSEIVKHMRGDSITNGEMVAVQVLGKIDPVYRAIDCPPSIVEMAKLFSNPKSDEAIGKLKDFEYFVFKDNN